MKNISPILYLLVVAFFCALLPTSLRASGTDVNEIRFQTFNEKYYQDKQIIDHHLGELAAVHGTIEEIESGPVGKPILKLSLSGVEKEIWVASVVKVMETQLSVGDEVDILGFFDETKNEPEYIAQLSSDKEYFLGFCLNVVRTGLPLYYVRWLAKCMEWESGALFNKKASHDKSDENSGESLLLN